MRVSIALAGKHVANCVIHVWNLVSGFASITLAADAAESHAIDRAVTKGAGISYLAHTAVSASAVKNVQ